MLQKLKAQGMPVYSALFVHAVRNEVRWTNDDMNKDRRAVMTLTSAGLLLEQKDRAPIITQDYRYLELE